MRSLRTTAARAVALALLIQVGGACVGSGPNPQVSTSASSGKGGLGLPPGTTRFRTGLAHLVVTGSTRRTSDLAVGDALLLPSGAALLTWRDATLDALVIDAPARVGAVKTSLASPVGGNAPTTIAASIGVGGDVPLIYTSHGGECSITFTRAGPDGVQGRVACSNLSNGAQSINVMATFAATR